MKIVAYYRVSTRRQGQSGLGLEGQQAAVAAYASTNSGQLVKSYTEVESGKRADRPELAKAIAHARLAKATLVIAKLDRLARNVAFLSALMESGCDFRACDNPHADRFTIHILAAVAEKEARDISARTKAALAAYKARGGLLGSARPECKDNLSAAAMAKGQQLAAVARQQKAKQAYAALVPLMSDLRQQGQTNRQIAAQLNAEGYTSRRGGPFNHVQVRLVLEREKATA
jgi:DNA invertase Pin-like site-specific DNA recombinase